MSCSTFSTTSPGLRLSPAADRGSLPRGGPPGDRPTAPAYFKVHETADGEWERVGLDGELDVGSAPVLRARLAALRCEKRRVRLDLSGLTFMDSSGVHLLLEMFNDSRENGWRLEVEGALSPQVHRLFNMTRLDRILGMNGD